MNVTPALHSRLWSKIDVRGTDDCWPFTGYLLKGYGRIGIGSRADGVAYAHRLVATEVFGTPQDGQQARHLCGNRACCNPAHLAWGSQSANEMDKVAHGLSNRGSRHGMSKLTESQVIEIRERLAGGETIAKLGAQFDVAPETISDIKCGATWGWLKAGEPVAA